VLARNEDCALRCIFHGWKIDVSGVVSEVPTHSPNPEAFAGKVPVAHYPTHEGGGIVWVWLGSSAPPPFPELPFTVLPQSHVWMSITKAYCNWLQGVEATIDTAHIGTLHSAYVAGNTQDRTNDLALKVLAPRYEVERQPYGIAAAGLRPVSDGTTYLRTTQYLMPFIALTPGSSELSAVIFIVSPIDDTHHNLFYGVYSQNCEIHDGANLPHALRSANGTKAYDPHAFGDFEGDREDNYGQDRAAMKGGHFSGFTGNLLQEDMVTQASMGAIVDRTKEHLSSSDIAIIHARRMLLDALSDVQAGRLPPGGERGADFRGVVPVNALLPAPDDAAGAIVDYYEGDPATRA
jgi:hypothetical protein